MDLFYCAEAVALVVWRSWRPFVDEGGAATALQSFNRITVTDSMKGFGTALGSVELEFGYSWYG
jgi:hypothetical protein